MERVVVEKQEITQALRKLSYGFYILTAGNNNDKAAGTVCWASQVSFEPPQVMVAIKHDSHLNRVVKETGSFALNVVGKAEKPSLSNFHRETKLDDGKINGHAYQDGETGAPLLDGFPTIIECKVVEENQPGDHTLFVGEVVNTIVNNKDAEPLMVWETDLRYGG